MKNHLRTLFRSTFAIGAVASSLLLVGNARADLFDTTLASPNTNGATGFPNTGNNSGDNPSWYNGAGNPQGGWTVSTDPTSGIEVGLRAKYRNVNAVIDTPTDDYTVSAGQCTLNPTCKGTSTNPALALWNYEFSIDLRPGGVGNLTLSDITATLTVTERDANNNVIATATVNPLTHWVDDSGFGSGLGGASGITSTGKDGHANANDWGAQNSENLGFGDSPLAGAFNPSAAYTYEFALTVIDASGRTLGSTDMEVQVTPEPSAVILLGTLLLAIFVFGRRKATA
jgi:hypothetical protein